MQRKVLVVDDEKIIADSLCAILRCSGFEAQAFYGAETALAACEQFVPDLVISDVSMPGMSGVELAVHIRERLPRCGVLLFSGDAQTRDVLDGAHRRGYDFELLSKPVHPRELLTKLEVVLGRESKAEVHFPDSNAESMCA